MCGVQRTKLTLALQVVISLLDESSLDVLKRIYKESFGFGDDVIELMGGILFANPLAATYGLFKDDEIVSAVMAVKSEGDIGIWNMATPIAHQKHGYGEQLLRHVMKSYKGLGAEKLLLTSSAAGKALCVLQALRAQFEQLSGRNRAAEVTGDTRGVEALGMHCSAGGNAEASGDFDAEDIGHQQVGA